MNILIIGGKQFVGYHIAKACIKQGHNIVFFNRGRTNSHLFPEYENIIGDRNKDLHLLQDRTFDYVIDTCAYFPNQVESVLDVMEGNFNKYLLISTLSVIKQDTPYFDESVGILNPDYTSTEITAETYGPLKSACEEVLTTRIKDKAIIIRPGYIVGDMDYTDRFTYYAIMMHYHQEVIIPKTNNLRYSFVDGKDLGAFVVHALDTNLSGIYHTVGPEELYFDDFINIVKNTVNKDCVIHYVDDQFLEENNLIKPLAFPTCNDSVEGNNVFYANTTKARNAGFTTRDIKESIQDGLDYFIRVKNNLDLLKVGVPSTEMTRLIEKIKKEQ